MREKTLRGLSVALLGGDKRQIVLAKELVRMGMKVYTAGLPEIPGEAKIKCCATPVEAVTKSQVIILPMPGVEENGQIKSVLSQEPIFFDETVVKAMKKGALIIVGLANDYLSMVAEKGQFKLVEINENDELAILNSVPSAEGAIQIAMQELPITIHGSESMVIGFGRLGQTLARMLRALGAKVTVVARKPKDLARAWEMGFKPIKYDLLAETLADTDIIFNTVPVLILTNALLAKVKNTSLVLDLSSAPYGVDFAAAKEFGLKAMIAPGLPGKVAPQTAGLLLAKVIPGIIAAELSLARQ